MKTEEILYHLETVSNAMLEIQRYASEMDYNTFVEDEWLYRPDCATDIGVFVPLQEMLQC